MGKFRYILFVIAAALALIAVPACSEDEEEEETKLAMYGVVSFDIPYYVQKGEIVTMSASGIKSPTEVIYKWYITGVYSDTLVSNKISVRFPDSIGVFTVYAGSFADEYYSSTTSQKVTTVDTTFGASLVGLPAGQPSVVDKRDGHRYKYVTVGNLDWFSQNLAYAGVGEEYMYSPAVWSLFGSAYYWEEATGGVSAHGLGAGPQGACPEGWSVPTNEDWVDLANAVKVGSNLPFADNWDGIGEKLSVDAYFNGDRMWPYNPDNAHSNDFGWNGLPMGYTVQEHSTFLGVNSYAYWWSSSEKNPSQAYFRYMHSDLSGFPMGATAKTDFGAFVRCVRMHPQF